MSSLKATVNNEATTFALSAAFGTSITVFIVEALHVPNAYIALSLSASLSLLPVPSFQGFLFRIGSVTLGVISAVLLMTLLSESPWVYFFLIGFISAVGYIFFLNRLGTGTAYAFSAYFAVMCIEAIFGISSSDVVMDALQLLSQSIIPIIVTYGVGLILQRTLIATNNPSLRSPLASVISIALVVFTSIIVALSIKTGESTRLMIASIAGITNLELERSKEAFAKKMVGYVLGAIISISYIVAFVAWTNDFGIYLLSLGCLFGFFEWLAHYYVSQQLLFRAISTMFSYSVLMLPAPDSNLHVSLERVVSSLIGFSISIAIFLLMEEAQKITQFMIHPKRQE